MKLLVDKSNDLIVALAYDINKTSASKYNPDRDYAYYSCKDKDGNMIPNKAFEGAYYIYDTGNDKVIEKELLNANIPGDYAIEDGRIVTKGSYSLDEIRKVKREVSYIKNTLEINQLDLLYEISLMQLGLA